MIGTNAREIEELEGQQQQRINDMKERKAWLEDHPISSHFEVEKNFAENNRISLTDAKRCSKTT